MLLKPPDKTVPLTVAMLDMSMYRCDGCGEWVMAYLSLTVKEHRDGRTDDRKCPNCNHVTTVTWDQEGETFPVDPEDLL